MYFYRNGDHINVFGLQSGDIAVLELLPDAETGENFPQQLVVADSASYFAKAVLALTQVLGE
jgi:hypothetical protein